VRRVIPFAILGTCLAVGVVPALADDQSVAIHDFAYAPAQVAVMPGQTVTWQADGGAMHSVHFDGEATGLGAPSATFHASREFDTEGTFTYHCDVHAFMHGTVYVNASGTVPTPSPQPSPSPTTTPEPATTPTPSSGGGGSGGGSATAPATSLRAKATVRHRRVFLTLTLQSAAPVRIKATLRRSGKRVRRATLTARPGKHTLRLPGKRLKPGRYSLTLRAGDAKRVLRLRVHK
jgi:hypothetical protein